MTNRIYILLHIESSLLWLWASTLMREYFAHFLADLGKSCHNLEKKKQNTSADPMPAGFEEMAHGVCSFFYYDFWFSRVFYRFGQRLPKFRENKKNCRPFVWRLWGDASWGLQFFVFLVLSRYLTDLGKGCQCCQNLEKTKKNKTADPMSGGIEEMPRGVCSFVFFLEDFVTCYDLIFSRCSQIHLLWLDIQQMVTDALFLRTLVVTGSEQMHVFWFVLLHFFRMEKLFFSLHWWSICIKYRFIADLLYSPGFLSGLGDLQGIILAMDEYLSFSLGIRGVPNFIVIQLFITIFGEY